MKRTLLSIYFCNATQYIYIYIYLFKYQSQIRALKGKIKREKLLFIIYRILDIAEIV